MRIMVTVGPATKLGEVHTGTRFQARPGIEVTNVNVISPWLVSAGQTFPVGIRVEVIEDDEEPTTRPLERILLDAIKHGRDYPGHSNNCACLDRLLGEMKKKVQAVLPTSAEQPDWQVRGDARRRVSYLLHTVVRDL